MRSCTQLCWTIALVLSVIMATAGAQEVDSEESPIRIGILHSRTGTMAISEESLVHAALLAVEELNATGGVLGRPLIPFVRDGESDPEVFKQQAELLIEHDKVSSIFGCWTSDCRKAVLTVIEDKRHLLWYPVQYEGGESSRRVIYTGAAPNQQIIPALAWCLDEVQRSKPGLLKKHIRVFLVGSDYVFPIEANRIIKAHLAEVGSRPVGEEYRPRGDRHFESIVAMIKAEDPHVIFNTVNGDSNVSFFEALANAWPVGQEPPMVMSVSIAEDEIRSMGTRFRKSVSARFTTGHYCAWNYFQSLDTPENKQFIARFRQYCEDNKLPGGLSRVTDDPIEAAYFQVHLFAKAVEKAGTTDPEAIRNAALGMEFSAPGGSIRIDQENQHTWKTVRIGKLRDDGQFDIQSSSTTAVRPEPYPTAAFPNGERGSGERKAWLRRLEAIERASVEGVDELKRGLTSEYPEVRQFAARKLGRFGTDASDAVTALGNALRDEDLLVSQNATEALGSMNFQAVPSLSVLITSLRHDRVGVRLRAADVVAQLARGLRDQRSTDALPELQDALEIMNDGDFLEDRVFAVRQAVTHLGEMQRADQTKMIRAILFGSVWFWIISGYLIAVAFFGFVGVRVFPLWMLRSNNVLKDYTDIKLLDVTVPLPVRHLLAMGWFHHNTHVLDAWVKEHIDIAKENFENSKTVSRRAVYVPVPVSVDGITIDDIDAKQFAQLCAKNRWCVHIRGAGGTGKTALACQMAIWAMSDVRDRRLCPDHKMIPVLIEPGLGQEVIKDVATLRRTVLGQLAVLVASDEEIPEELCEHLLRTRRVLVIIDDLGALAAPRWALPGEAGFPCNALIITSRTEEKLGNARPTVVEPLRVSGNQLSSFLEAYLQRKGWRSKFEDTEFFEECQKLAAMVGTDEHDKSKTAMTVLFAKMYAEQLIGAKAPGAERSLPRDVPNLMLGYIDELNRAYDEFEDRDVQRAAKLVAWECCKKTFRPGIRRRDDLLALFGQQGERMVAHLEDRLIIIQSAGADHEWIRFTIDPLAEYLAGFHLKSVYKNDNNKWSKLLAEVEAQGASKGESAGFLRALRDCCLAKDEEKTPSDLPERIASLAGLGDESVDVIKVGVLHSLTGQMAMSEHPLVGSIELAIEEINRRGGVLGRKIVAVIEDGKSDWPTFAEKARKLIEKDKVCSVFGCWTSASRREVLPVFVEHNHLLWYPVQYEGFETSRNVIYTGAAPNQQIIPAIDWCVDHLGPKVFLVGSAYIFPRRANAIIKAYLRRRELETVGEEYVTLGDRDFGSVVEKIQKVNPDVVFNTVNGESNRGLFTDLDKAGIRAEDTPVMSVSMAEVEVRNIGITLTKGHYCAWNYFQSIDTPTNDRFVDAFKRLKGMEIPTDDPIEASYFQVHLFAKALEKARVEDPRAIREAARGLSFRAPGGDVRIDRENQHTWKVARIGRIREDGQFDIVWRSPEPIRPDPELKWLFPDGPPSC